MGSESDGDGGSDCTATIILIPLFHDKAETFEHKKIIINPSLDNQLRHE